MVGLDWLIIITRRSAFELHDVTCQFRALFIFLIYLKCFISYCASPVHAYVCVVNVNSYVNCLPISSDVAEDSFASIQRARSQTVSNRFLFLVHIIGQTMSNLKPNISKHVFKYTFLFGVHYVMFCQWTQVEVPE